MKEKVRAAVMIAPGKIEINEYPYPKLEEGAMLIRMEMSGICGTDKHIYKGEGKLYSGTERETDIDFPIIPGHENVGIIAEITGSAKNEMEFNGEKLDVGDRVTMCPDVVCGKCYYCRNIAGFTWCENMRAYGHSLDFKNPPYLFGGWSEYLYIKPGTFIYKVPKEIPANIAVLSELFAVAYNMDKAKEFYSMSGEGFASADTVLIQGVGPLGLAHLIKSRMLGCGDIICIDKSEYRLKLAKEFGANYLINFSKTKKEDRIEIVKQITKGRGADVVVECCGVAEVIKEGIEMTRRGGMYIVAGNFVESGEISISPHRHLCSKNIRLIGMTNLSINGFTPSLKLMEIYKNQFPWEKFVSHMYNIEDAEEGIKKSMELDCMKVVITP